MKYIHPAVRLDSVFDPYGLASRLIDQMRRLIVRIINDHDPAVECWIIRTTIANEGSSDIGGADMPLAQ